MKKMLISFVAGTSQRIWSRRGFKSGLTWLKSFLGFTDLQFRPSPRATAQRIFAGDMLSLFKYDHYSYHCHINTMMSTSRMLTVMLDSDVTQNVNSSCLFRSSSPTCNYIHPGPEQYSSQSLASPRGLMFQVQRHRGGGGGGG